MKNPRVRAALCRRLRDQRVGRAWHGHDDLPLPFLGPSAGFWPRQGQEKGYPIADCCHPSFCKMAGGRRCVYKSPKPTTPPPRRVNALPTCPTVPQACARERAAAKCPCEDARTPPILISTFFTFFQASVAVRSRGHRAHYGTPSFLGSF